MCHINENSLGTAWVKYMQVILSNGECLPDDMEPILETGCISIRVDSCDENDEIVLRHEQQGIRELYISKMFSEEIITEFNSTYGDRLFNEDGINQVEWAINRLKTKWWSKSASISLLRPNDSSPRIPCMISLLPVIRKGELELNAVFRSQNAFRSYGNFYGLKEIQKVFCKSLGIGAGAITSVSLRPHIYESDISVAERIVSTEAKNERSNNHIHSDPENVALVPRSTVSGPVM